MRVRPWKEGRTVTLWTLGMGTSSSLVATAIVYWIVERNLINALIIGGTGIAVFIITIIFAKKPSAAVPPTPLIKDSGNATATGGAGGHASIGPITVNVGGSSDESVNQKAEQLSNESVIIAFLKKSPAHIGYDYEEIAEATNLPKRDVRDALQRLQSQRRVRAEGMLEAKDGYSYFLDDVERTTAAPISRPETPRPKLELLSWEPAMIFYQLLWKEMNPTEIGPQLWKPNAYVARFRIRSTAVGEKPLSAYGATAHLTYRNGKGNAQVINFGTWLGKYENKVDFRGNSNALILSSTTTVDNKTSQGQTYVFDNPHGFNIFSSPRSFSGRTIYAPKEALLLQDCTEVEIEIRNSDATLFKETLDRDGDGWKPRPSS
jgi:hypothetical protein